MLRSPYYKGRIVCVKRIKSIIMSDDSHSKTVLDSKTNSDRLDNIATRLLQFQEQFQESLLQTK